MRKTSIICLSVIILTSCSKMNQTPTGELLPVPVPQKAANTISFDDAYSNIKSEYKNSDSMNSCMANMINTCLNQAVTESAQKKNDEAVCEDLSEPMTVEFCKQGVILSKIEKWWDISLCNALKQNKEGCRMQATINLANKKKDIKLCDTIKSPELTGTWVLTPLLQTYTKENCIDQVAFNIATMTQDATYCDKISNESQKNMCHNAVTPKKSAVIPEKKVTTRKKK